MTYYVPSDTDIIYVADFLLSDYPTGGAELTSSSLVSELVSQGKKVFEIRSREVIPRFVKEHKEKIWLLGNHTRLPKDTRYEIVKTVGRYFIVEYDFKFCCYRSPSFHLVRGEGECRCNETEEGNYSFWFFKRAKHVFFMSRRHLEIYKEFFPDIENWNNVSILGSQWSKSQLAIVEKSHRRRAQGDTATNGKHMVLGSGSWVKGLDEAKKALKGRGIEYDVVGGYPYMEFLEKMSEYDTLYFHPKGYDTDPRIVTEALLIGLNVDLGENVLSRNEMIELSRIPLESRIEKWKESKRILLEKFTKKITLGDKAC